jgi:hypothetical protein
VGTRRRIARGINETLYSLHYLAKLPREVQRFDAEARIVELREAAANVGLTVDTRWVEESRPGMQTIVSYAFGDDELGTALYNYQSAVAHGTAFGLAGSLAIEHVEQHPLATAPRVPQVTTASGVLGAFASVELALRNAVERRRIYNGWPEDGWSGCDWQQRSHDAVTEALERLGVRQTAEG